MLTLTLPWPPSVNNLYATVNGRRVLSANGRAYHKAVLGAVLEQVGLQGRFGKKRVSYFARVSPPDAHRRRDLSNLIKSMEDALTHARIWDDDSQVDRLTIVRGAPLVGGSVLIQIEEIT